MSTTMDQWRTKRAAWTKARDDAKVKKGAVSSVSLGDSLDKIYKAAGKGYGSLAKAVTAAEKDLKTYQTKGGKAVAPVSTWLKTVGDDLEELRKAAEADAEMLTTLNADLIEFHQLAVPGIDVSLLVNIDRVMNADKTGATTWSDAEKKVGMYRPLPAVLKMWAETIKRLQTLTYEVKLPGKDPYYKWLDAEAGRYRAGYKLLSGFKSVQTLAEHNIAAKAADGPISELTANMRKTTAAVKALTA